MSLCFDYQTLEMDGFAILNYFDRLYQEQTAAVFQSLNVRIQSCEHQFPQQMV